MLLSFALQVIAVTVGVVISICTVDKLGAFSLPHPMPPAPRMKAVQVVAVKPYAAAHPSTGLHAPARPFVVPRRIPVGLPTITDAPDMELAQFPTVALGDGPIGPGTDSSIGILHASPSTVAARPVPKQAPERPKEVQQVAVGGKVLETKLMKRVMPSYPPLARQMRVSGVVRLEGLISREGRIVKLRVVSGHPLLAAAAVEAVRQWVYRPTLLNGESVEVSAPIDVNFILSQQ